MHLTFYNPEHGRKVCVYVEHFPEMRYSAYKSALLKTCPNDTGCICHMFLAPGIQTVWYDDDGRSYIITNPDFVLEYHSTLHISRAPKHDLPPDLNPSA